MKNSICRSVIYPLSKWQQEIIKHKLLLYEQEIRVKEGTGADNKSKIFQLKDIVKRVDESGTYFFDFLGSNDLEAGIIRLHPDENDSQEPHSLDELYYIVEGSGFIKISGQDRMVEKGSIVFIPKGVNHRFHGNKDDLVVLYVFGRK